MEYSCYFNQFCYKISAWNANNQVWKRVGLKIHFLLTNPSLILSLLSNPSFSSNWCSSIIFSLSLAPDNIHVTVCSLISMNYFTMIDSLTESVIGCLDLFNHHVQNCDVDGRHAFHRFPFWKHISFLFTQFLCYSFLSFIMVFLKTC